MATAGEKDSISKGGGNGSVRAALQRAHTYIKDTVVEGGWPYKPGQKEMSTEATAWCGIALRDEQPFARKTWSRLMETRNNDGGWSTAPNMGLSDWTSGPALLCVRILNASGAGDKNSEKQIRHSLEFLFDSRTDFYPTVARLLLFAWKGREGLSYARGWPWTRNCFHWIEPTSYALYALKIPQRPKAEVYNGIITRAQDFILGTECKGGGWNHGSSFCLNTYLPPFIVTTAEALIAMQGFGDDIVTAGLDFLAGKERTERSAMEYAWSILALNAYDRPCTELLESLAAGQNKDGSFGLDNMMVTALCTLALDTVNGRNPLKIKA
ncbi:MAG TPA: hypothetical protein V6C81_29635 [Planktothrix sp.]|jgi:hypothetical protein